MYNNLHKRKIPLILLNARITKKSFNRWKYLENFSKNIFEKINVALPQNMETKKYLKSVLLGLEWYLKNQRPITNNQFGSHKWFSLVD